MNLSSLVPIVLARFFLMFQCSILYHLSAMHHMLENGYQGAREQ
jgi:hypothetical protein